MNRDFVIRANRRAYDELAQAQSPLCRPAKSDDLTDPLGTVDAAGWLGPSISGWRVLCLAAGGGRQSSIYAAAGADVTVVDLSGAMLELDRRVAAERGFSARLIEASMDDLSMLRAGEFDLVVHPVSTCYVPDVGPVFREVARVLRAGGLYISQHKTPANLQSSYTRGVSDHYQLEHRYYRQSPLPAADPSSAVARRLREHGAIEFLHRWEQLVGGICRAGFVIEDLVEPTHADRDPPRNSFTDRANFVAPYVRIKARRTKAHRTNHDQTAANPVSQLWMPTDMT